MVKKILNSASGYNLAASDYDKKQAYLNSFEKDVIWELLGDVKGKKVLDAGVGTGRIAFSLLKKGAVVTALDISEGMLFALESKVFAKGGSASGGISLKSKVNLRVVIGDAESLPFSDKSFDLVIGAFLIVHLKDPARFFDEAYRVLKPGGKLLVTNINQKRPPKIKTKEGMIEIESYYHRPEKIKEMLDDLAFGIEREEFVKENGVWINQIILANK